MPHLLRIDSSISPDSRTRAITQAYEDAWTARGEDWTLTRRDLTLTPPPHLLHSALHWPARLRSAEVDLPEIEAAQQEILAEIAAADVLVIGAPMYNYAPASTLKAWLDHVHVPGLTAPFDGDTQPYAGKTAVIVSARGGAYDPAPEAGDDHVIAPIRLVLGSGLGMQVDTIVTSRTLAAILPDLGLEQSEAELQAALAEAARHAGAYGA
ncbi:FMN-dependent NADH-azoreductase [Brachybacterium hainanense]|uniref:FMN dependent NADH:quinone oxidoreductase n=1 Tax=Brachybacterium hainanense TaxID=1541174 RepID=A0ABV6RAP3_9MICO